MVALAPTQSSAVLRDFAFEDGTVLDLEIAFWTLGELDADGANLLLLSHGASGSKDWALPYCTEGGAFAPAGRLVVSIDLPGGGGSSRASTTPAFPNRYSLHDLTRAIVQLVDQLGAKRDMLFCGPSVSTLIGLDLAATRPDLIGGLALWNCGVRCDGFAGAVVSTISAILEVDSGELGMRTAVEAFFPNLVGRSLAAASTADERERLIQPIAESWISAWRADEIAARYAGTMSGDVPAIHGGENALIAKLACPILFLPSSSDQILLASDIVDFASKLPGARIAICQTDQGHGSTGAPAGSPEFDFFNDHTREFLRGLSAKR